MVGIIIIIINYYYCYPPHLRAFFIALIEKGRERRKEREKHQCEREVLIDCYMFPDWGLNPQPRYVS